MEVTGRTRKELFVNAVWAVFDIMIENKAGRKAANRQKKITVEGADVADLLINFLRELLICLTGNNL